MFFPDPDFYPPKNGQQKRAVTTNLLSYIFFCSHKFHKIVNYFIFEMLKKKNWASFQRIIKLFTQKFVTNLPKIWVWDPGSEIRDLGYGKNYSGSRIRVQGSKSHRIQDPDPQHWSVGRLFVRKHKQMTKNPRKSRSPNPQGL
jgi:hypothetical protein